jgi:co-chaperonin GroES (HSP10)
VRIRVLHDLVLVRIDPPDEHSQSPTRATASTYEWFSWSGLVVAVGPGRWSQKGRPRRLPMLTRPGDRVVVDAQSGQIVDVGGVEHRFIREEDLLGFEENYQGQALEEVGDDGSAAGAA